jgi:hypothetical protein
MCAGGPAEEYCNRLQTQNSGEQVVKLMLLAGRISHYLFLCLFCCMITGCFTCCCCCARPDFCICISTPCSRRCFRYWGRLVTLCGCGWCAFLAPYPSNLPFYEYAAVRDVDSVCEPWTLAHERQYVMSASATGQAVFLHLL